MKAKKYTEEQIITVLREGEAGGCLQAIVGVVNPFIDHSVDTARHPSQRCKLQFDFLPGLKDPKICP